MNNEEYLMQRIEDLEDEVVYLKEQLREAESDARYWENMAPEWRTRDSDSQ